MVIGAFCPYRRSCSSVLGGRTLREECRGDNHAVARGREDLVLEDHRAEFPHGAAQLRAGLLGRDRAIERLVRNLYGLGRGRSDVEVLDVFAPLLDRRIRREHRGALGSRDGLEGWGGGGSRLGLHGLDDRGQSRIIRSRCQDECRAAAVRRMGAEVVPAAGRLLEAELAFRHTRERLEEARVVREVQRAKRLALDAVRAGTRLDAEDAVDQAHTEVVAAAALLLVSAEEIQPRGAN
jgi:hypothetical protein